MKTCCLSFIVFRQRFQSQSSEFIFGFSEETTPLSIRFNFLEKLSRKSILFHIWKL